MSLNEAFSTNVLGKQIAYDIQPYERAKGVIVGCTPRRIKGVKQHCPINGTMLVDYECFDLEVEVEEGSATGALWGGVPVSGTTKGIEGQKRSVTGVSYGQLRRAAFEGDTIVIARCG